MGPSALASTSSLSPITSCIPDEPGCTLSLQQAPSPAARLRSKDFNSGSPLVRVWNAPGVAASIQHRRSFLPLASQAKPGQEIAPATANEVPGDEGPPLLVSVLDRYEYWNKGPDDFFAGLIQKYGSTVIRVTMPPGRPFFPKSQTIMLFDQKSYPVLFDISKVDKKDVFTGTFMPSVKFTGGFRMLSYLDPSEKKHELLKNFCFDSMKTNAKRLIPDFQEAFDEACSRWEEELAKKGTADVSSVCQEFTLSFLFRNILGRDPATPGEASLGTKASSHIQTWVAAQIFPRLSAGLPKPIEFFLHTVPLPYFLVASHYQKLYKFFSTYSQELLDMAVQKYGLDREEACHNLLFNTCFNMWGGIQSLYPYIINRIAQESPEFQAELAVEVRKAVKACGGLTMAAVDSMELVHSTVWEVLRMDPPVLYQYGRAKDDLIIESHDAEYKVKKGETIGGYVKMAMRDPKVFDAAEEFRPKRFMGQEGKKLLPYLLWSNGPETEDPAVGNKQCAGKNFTILLGCLLVAGLFLKYDQIKIGPTTVKGMSKIFSFTSLEKKASA